MALHAGAERADAGQRAPRRTVCLARPGDHADPAILAASGITHDAHRALCPDDLHAGCRLAAVERRWQGDPLLRDRTACPDRRERSVGTGYQATARHGRHRRLLSDRSARVGSAVPSLHLAG